MLKQEEVVRKIDSLIALAMDAKRSRRHTQFGEFIENEPFNQLRSSSLSFLRLCFGIDHPIYKEFIDNVNSTSPHVIDVAIGILKAAKQEVLDGWVLTVKGLVSAEIFSDFLEMADHLLEEGYKDAAAVMAGSVLEEHLRQLCQKNSIDVIIEQNGKARAKKADLLNSELCAAGVYNKLDQKSITSWLDLRNKAAHGQYSEYAKEQVNLMQRSITEFMTRIP